MPEENEQEEVENNNVCPVCGSEDIIHQGRCTTCLECGWSKCDL